MKKFINVLLSICSPLAAVPTGWAIYAGVTETPAFPMHPIAAGIGAVAIIVVNIAAGMLIIDAYGFNQSAQDGEQSQPLLWSWAVLVVGVAAEIVLSLLIVVFDNLLKFGVLAFPIMTLAGVFVVSIRSDLMIREQDRKQTREKNEQERLAKIEEEKVEREEAKKARAERRAERPQSGKSKGKQAKKSAVLVACPHGCGLKATQNGVNSHSRWCEKNPANQFARMVTK